MKRIGPKLEKFGLGEVSGGGTVQGKDGEIERYDIEIEVEHSSDEVMKLIVQSPEVSSNASRKPI